MGTFLGRNGPISYVIYDNNDGTFSVLSGDKGDECVIVESGLTYKEALDILSEKSLEDN